MKKKRGKKDREKTWMNEKYETNKHADKQWKQNKETTIFILSV